MNRTSRRQDGGFAIMLVMLTVAIAVVLGFSYLSSASIKMTSSVSLVQAGKARYLAESALQHGLHVLKTSAQPPETLMTCGPFHADNSGDSYTFTIEPAGDELWRISGSGNSGKIKQQTSAIIRRSSATVIMDEGVFVDGNGTMLPPSATVNGDMHLNGTLYNLASINGDVTSSSAISDPFLRIRGARISWVDDRKSPDIKANDYNNYHYAGIVGQPRSIRQNELDEDHSIAEGRAITAANPAGVVNLRPNSGSTVSLDDDFEFVGTLIVQGNLLLDGRRIRVRAVNGFPALIVSGRIYVTNRTEAVIDGLVIAKKGVSPNGLSGSSRTEINGGLVCDERGYDLLLGGEHVMNYVASRCRILDVTKPDATPAMQIVSWLD